MNKPRGKLKLFMSKVQIKQRNNCDDLDLTNENNEILVN